MRSNQRTHDALEPEDVHAVPGQEEPARVLTTVPDPVWPEVADVVRAVHRSLIAIARLVCGERSRLHLANGPRVRKRVGVPGRGALETPNLASDERQSRHRRHLSDSRSRLTDPRFALRAYRHDVGKRNGRQHDVHVRRREPCEMTKQPRAQATTRPAASTTASHEAAKPLFVAEHRDPPLVQRSPQIAGRVKLRRVRPITTLCSFTPPAENAPGAPRAGGRMVTGWRRRHEGGPQGLERQRS